VAVLEHTQGGHISGSAGGQEGRFVELACGAWACLMEAEELLGDEQQAEQRPVCGAARCHSARLPPKRAAGPLLLWPLASVRSEATGRGQAARAAWAHEHASVAASGQWPVGGGWCAPTASLRATRHSCWPETVSGGGHSRAAASCERPSQVAQLCTDVLLTETLADWAPCRPQSSQLGAPEGRGAKAGGQKRQAWPECAGRQCAAATVCSRQAGSMSTCCCCCCCCCCCHRWRRSAGWPSSTGAAWHKLWIGRRGQGPVVERAEQQAGKWARCLPEESASLFVSVCAIVARLFIVGSCCCRCGVVVVVERPRRCCVRAVCGAVSSSWLAALTARPALSALAARNTAALQWLVGLVAVIVVVDVAIAIVARSFLSRCLRAFRLSGSPKAQPAQPQPPALHCTQSAAAHKPRTAELSSQSRRFSRALELHSRASAGSPCG